MDQWYLDVTENTTLYRTHNGRVTLGDINGLIRQRDRNKGSLCALWRSRKICSGNDPCDGCGDEGLTEKRGPAEGKRGLYIVDSKSKPVPMYCICRYDWRCASTIRTDGRNRIV